jgi:hypothetical protein
MQYKAIAIAENEIMAIVKKFSNSLPITVYRKAGLFYKLYE